MMEEREKYEWRLREEQIKEIQNARLDVLKEMLEDRETKQNEVIEGNNRELRSFFKNITRA